MSARKKRNRRGLCFLIIEGICLGRCVRIHLVQIYLDFDRIASSRSKHSGFYTVLSLVKDAHHRWIVSKF